MSTQSNVLFMKLINFFICSAQHQQPFDGQFSDFDQWVRQNDERVHGVAEKLREQFNTALTRSSGRVGGERYFQRCTTKCELQPGTTGRTQQELDTIAIDMTNQIVSDLREGRLTRTQVNQPQWYEHRVAEKLAELERNVQQQFQSTAASSSSSSNHFNSQSQGGFRSVFPSRDWHMTNEQNCTTNGPLPTFNLQNQLNTRHDKEAHVVQQHGVMVPVFGGSYFNHNNFHESRQTSNGAVVQPILRPSQTFHRSSSIVEQKESHSAPPVVVQLPTQSYHSVREEHEERHESATARPVYIGGTRTQHRNDRFYQSEVVPNYRPRVTVDNNYLRELEEHSHVKTTNHVPVVVMPTPVISSTSSSQVREHSVMQNNQRPLIYLPSRTVSTVNNEEQRVDTRVERPMVQERISTTHTEEQQHEENQVRQRPVYQPTAQSHVSSSQHVEERHESRTQPLPLPIFSHHSYTHEEDVKESRGGQQQQQHVYVSPSGHKVSTVRESTSVQIAPQFQHQYITEYTDEEYTERLERTQQTLQQLGYNALSEREYNATIAAGGFVHNGVRYLYDGQSGRYERTEHTQETEEETVEEHRNQMRQLQQVLAQHGFSQMTEQEFNETISGGTFVRNGERYSYDLDTGRILRIELTEHEYRRRYDRIGQELRRLGLRTLTDHEYNQTISSNNVWIDGVHFTFDTRTGRLETEQRTEENTQTTQIDHGQQQQQVTIAEHEYRTTLRRLQELLTRLGVNQMTEREYNETITRGEFVRGGHHYRLNAYTGNFERLEITEAEYAVLLTRLRDTIARLGYRQMSQSEYNETISGGHFVRGGYQWSYNTETGEANRVRVAGAFDEITDVEYHEILRRLQETLTGMDYERMSSSECNATITSGTFTRGGNQWVYNGDTGDFEHVELSATEFQYRLERLTDILRYLNTTRDEQEMRAIINRGNFYHGGHRYEYNTRSSVFERIELSATEYEERVRRLLEQLVKIGYGTMDAAQCRATIDSGVFYYGGYEWVYNHRTGWYEMGARSDREPGIGDVPSTADYDNTKYDSTKAEEAKTAMPPRNNRRPPENISRNRGDQPPQVIDNDYEDSEELVPEPAPRPTARPRPLTPPTAPSLPPVVYPTAGGETHSRYEHQRTTDDVVSVAVPVVPSTQTEYKKTYHRKQTVYTQSLVSNSSFAQNILNFQYT